MASIDCCLRLLEADVDKLFAEYEQKLENFQKEIKPLKNLILPWHNESTVPEGIFAYDRSKIVISTKNTAISGMELMEKLRNVHKIELEKSCKDYAIAMTSICDSGDGLSRLAAALGALA